MNSDAWQSGAANAVPFASRPSNADQLAPRSLALARDHELPPWRQSRSAIRPRRIAARPGGVRLRLRRFSASGLSARRHVGTKGGSALASLGLVASLWVAPTRKGRLFRRTRTHCLFACLACRPPRAERSWGVAPGALWNYEILELWNYGNVKLKSTPILISHCCFHNYSIPQYPRPFCS